MVAHNDGAWTVKNDEILPNFDFANSRRVTSKEAWWWCSTRRGRRFGSPKEANEALRALAGIIKKRRPRGPSSK
jgi:hypothetical protein